MGLFEGAEKATEAKAKEEPGEAEPRPTSRVYGVRLDLKEESAVLTSGMQREYPATIANTGTEDDTVRIRFSLDYDSELPEPPEWGVEVSDVEDKVWDLTFTKIFEKEIVLIGGGQRDIRVRVTCPKGARFGDRLTLLASAISKGDVTKSDTKTLAFTGRQAVLAVKTSIGHERAVADGIHARARVKDVGIFSILAPPNLRGYVLVESMNPDRLEEVVRGVRRAHGVVKGEGESAGIGFTDIDLYLEPKPIVSGIMEGDIVELIAGPFKSEKARVMKIDETKEEITVELFEAMVRIPVTVRGDHVRVLQKEDER